MLYNSVSNLATNKFTEDAHKNEVTAMNQKFRNLADEYERYKTSTTHILINKDRFQEEVAQY